MSGWKKDPEMEWKFYARYKAGKCCGSGCEGCVYDPIHTKFVNGNDPNKNLQGWFVKELQKINPENSPSSDYHHLPEAEKAAIVNLLRKGECPPKYWELYYGKKAE